MNTPIQGSAADILKIAMIKVRKRLHDENLDAKIVLQVHDEIILEASEKDSEHAAQVLKQEMEHAAQLHVPLKADVSSGKTWYAAKE
jgi:DNA polymerase-1